MDQWTAVNDHRLVGVVVNDFLIQQVSVVVADTILDQLMMMLILKKPTK